MIETHSRENNMSNKNIITLHPSRSSGDLYHKVTTIGVYGFNGEPYSLARPKSP